MTITNKKSNVNSLTVSLQNISELKEFCSLIADGYKVSKNFSKSGKKIAAELTHPAYIFKIVCMGAEIGLKPLQSLQNINIIDGKPVLWGDGMLAVVRDSGCLKTFSEYFSKEDYDESKTTRQSMVTSVFTDDFAAICRIQRDGYKEKVYKFSVLDAKIANLWHFDTKEDRRKYSPWYKYPKRMLQMRARSWALRDTFADYLAGFSTVEEQRDVHQTYEESDKNVVKIKKVTNTEVKIDKEKIVDVEPINIDSLFDKACEAGTKKSKEEIIEYLGDISKRTKSPISEIAERASHKINDFLIMFDKWCNSK